MRLTLGALALAASLAFAAPAGATISQTHVTTPASSPTYLTYNGDKGNTFAISGTTDSTDPSTDTADIRCFFGDDGLSRLVAGGVTLNGDGSFSVPAASLSSVAAHECWLAALPQGDTTLEPGFTGPQLEVSQRQTTLISGGPNAGKPSDFYAWGQQIALADDYRSIGTCGLCDSYLQDTAGGLTSIVFYANAYLWFGNQAENGDKRSEIQIDGKNAYAPGAAASAFKGSNQEDGFPALKYKFSQNSHNGDTTITEVDQFARCGGSGVYPPTSSTCPTFKPTGVQVSRKVVQNASGHMVSITDTYRSTNGRPHRLDLLYDNEQCLTTNSCNASRVGYQFPGATSYAAHAPGNVVHVRKGIGSIYVKVLGAPDGDPYTGQGAITFGSAPTEVVFTHPFSYDASQFVMHYAAKLPAKGTLTYRFVYSTALTRAQVRREALAAQHALKAQGSVDMQAAPGPVSAPVDGLPTRTTHFKHGRL